MLGIDIKLRFSGSGSKSRLFGGAAIRYGGGRKLQNQTIEKGPTPGLEYVFFIAHKSNAKMMTQFRKGMDAIAAYIRRKRIRMRRRTDDSKGHPNQKRTTR